MNGIRICVPLYSQKSFLIHTSAKRQPVRLGLYRRSFATVKSKDIFSRYFAYRRCCSKQGQSGFVRLGTEDAFAFIVFCPR